MSRYLPTLLGAIIANFMLLWSAISFCQGLTPRQQADSAFGDAKYRSAIGLYRKHLKKERRDYQAWQRLAASYYYLGRIDRSERILTKLRIPRDMISFNLYYRGLCALAKGEEKTGFKLLKRAAGGVNRDAAISTLELAVQYYLRQQPKRSSYWLGEYQSRFKPTVGEALAEKLSQLLRQKKYGVAIATHRAPRPESAIFKTDPASLFPFPHYWFVGGGYHYSQATVSNPVTGRQRKIISQETIPEHKVNLQLGLELGSFQWQAIDVDWKLGYHYLQDWLATDERIAVYTADPADFDYFPFRPDLMERRHHLFGQLARKFGGLVFTELYFALDYARQGTAVFNGPDGEIASTLDVFRATTLIPLFGFSWSQQHTTRIHSYLRKEIRDETPQFSYQSYTFDEPDAGLLTMSWGLDHTYLVPDIGFQFQLSLFRYAYIFNDIWLDHIKSGALLEAYYHGGSSYGVGVTGGYYRDSYQLPRIRTGGCQYADEGDEVITCGRSDLGQYLALQGDYFPSKVSVFSAKLVWADLDSGQFRVFDENRLGFQVDYTYSFPARDRRETIAFRDRHPVFEKKVE